MRIDDVALHDLTTSNTAVVRALRSWVTILGPAVRAVVKVEEGVFSVDIR